MIAALVDNGSLLPSAHRVLRAVASGLGTRTGQPVAAVSWKHSDRIDPTAFEGRRPWTLRPWLRAQLTRGENEFLFVPFFISAQGAIGSALEQDLAAARREFGSFRYAFSAGLAAQGALAPIVAARIRETIAARGLATPAVIVVDHGGPSPESAALRNATADQLRRELGPEIRTLSPASMEGEAYEHCRPLLAEILRTPGFDQGDVVIAPLFLAPGRHAGPQGDLARIASAAQDRCAATDRAGLRCHFTELVGTHPLAEEALASGLQHSLNTFHLAA